MGDYVYSEARHTEVQVLTAADAEEAFLPDDGIHGSHALFIGGDLGLVIEGDIADLRAVAERILVAVREAEDASQPHDCDDGPAVTS